mmetsp:Transcript_14825/g.20686  ORF Transcript_14825/g.20686 Transcript_14825/m.20686 type:complete len:229 (-) Transcript_14825:65-751(-)
MAAGSSTFSSNPTFGMLLSVFLFLGRSITSSLLANFFSFLKGATFFCLLTPGCCRPSTPFLMVLGKCSSGQVSSTIRPSPNIERRCPSSNPINSTSSVIPYQVSNTTGHVPSWCRALEPRRELSWLSSCGLKSTMSHKLPKNDIVQLEYSFWLLGDLWCSCLGNGYAVFDSITISRGKFNISNVLLEEQNASIKDESSKVISVSVEQIEFEGFAFNKWLKFNVVLVNL